VAFLAQQWRQAQATNSGVKTAHLQAQQLTEDSLIAGASDAQSEATRRQSLRGVMRDMWLLVVALTPANAAVDLGQIVQLTHPRYGLGGGKLFLVLGLKPDGAARTLTFTVWG
jgi:hypothetical protein